MFNKIESISKVSSASNKKIQPVRRHSKEEIEKLYKDYQEASDDRKAFEEYLNKYPNPDKLSFDELLKRAASGLIIDVGKKSEEDDGVILSISSKQ